MFAKYHWGLIYVNLTDKQVHFDDGLGLLCH